MTEETVTPIQETTEEEQNPITETEELEDPTLLGPEKNDSPEDQEAKDGEDAEKSEVPEKYEVKLPEGMDLDEATLDLFSPIFKELGITNEGAQKLVDAYIPLIQSTVDEQRKQSQNEFKGIVDGWKKETMTELGPSAKDELAAAGRAINKFGSPELREIMQETGVGNHKELVKFMAKIGKTISEDAMVDPNNTNAPSGKLDAHKMYPSMPQ